MANKHWNDPVGMTAADLAEKIGVPKKTNAGIWLTLQKTYELDIAAKAVGTILKKIMPYDAGSSAYPASNG